MTNKTTPSKTSRRRDDRHPQQLTNLSVVYEGFEEDICVRPPDLSVHGMFINTGRAYPEGAVLKLRFQLARTGIEVQTRGEVRYCLKGVGIGVEFMGISLESVRAIEEEIGVVPHRG